MSIEDAIMFCNRTLSQKFRELFSRVFKATELTPYDLFGSPPHDLLLFYRQSLKQAKEVNRLVSIFFLFIIHYASFVTKEIRQTMPGC